jgi:arylsulfatase A-like enzyme
MFGKTHGWSILTSIRLRRGLRKDRASVGKRSHEGAPFQPRFLHLFAAFCGLTTLLLIIRFVTLKHPPLRRYFGILAYQDLFVCAVLAWLFFLAFISNQNRLIRSGVAILGWALCVLFMSYSALSAVVYTVLHAPITYSLWLAGDHLQGARASVLSSLSTYSLMIFLKSFLIFAGVTEGLWRLAPSLLKRTATIFYSPLSAVVLAAYFIVAHAWAMANVRYLPAIANPELALLTSFFAPLDPLVIDKVPARYFAEFDTAESRLGSESALAASYSPIHTSASWRPRNILMVIMESVGSRRLQIYDAPYPDTPQMMRLAQHAMIFDRMYVAQAYTSGAMSALFCSLSPQLGWQPTTRSQPDIDVPGIADVLVQNGYATAFMHPGQLGFDHEGDFLAHHGFRDMFFAQDDPTFPADSALAEVADKWLTANSKRPFFLTLWTEDTHHPYFASDSYVYDASDHNLNRYLNAIHSTDALIGKLADTLERLHLSDDTLIVITGDHGEAFGEHNQTADNWTVYDEEMRIPLILINPRLFPHIHRIEHLGRQIDIPATLLALLGYSQPRSWQGDSLFGSKLVDHAYLFSRYGNYTFGIVDAKSKYVFDFNRDRAEYYDLAADPMEKHDLSANPALSPILAADRLKIEAWILYQRQYLKEHRHLLAAANSSPGVNVINHPLTLDRFDSDPASQPITAKTQQFVGHRGRDAEASYSW